MQFSIKRSASGGLEVESVNVEPQMPTPQEAREERRRAAQERDVPTRIINSQQNLDVTLPEEPIKLTPEVPKTHVCDHCGFSAMSAAGLSAHVRNKHDA